MESEPTVFVVDDDKAVREGIALLVKSVGLKVRCFENAQQFLDACDPSQPGCLVLDVRMPGMSGLELREKLAEHKVTLPVIFLTGHGDVGMGVRAIKNGAVDFIEKPPNDQVLLDSVHKAIELDAAQRRRMAEQKSVAERAAKLTPRERQVMARLVQGKSDKQIAFELGISVRGVAFHRANILEKLEVDSVVELTRVAIEFGL